MKRLLNVLLALVMVVSIIPIATNAEGTTLTGLVDNDKYAATMREMIADFNATNSKGTVIVGEQIPWMRFLLKHSLQAAIGAAVLMLQLSSLPQRHRL